MLVDERDERMATAICQAAALPGGQESGEGESGEEMAFVVGVFGLVHLDGIRQRISERGTLRSSPPAPFFSQKDLNE